MPRRDDLTPAQIAAINARREAAGKAVLGDDEDPTDEEVAEVGEASTDEAAEEGATYTVKEGDTLGQIAIDNDTTVEALVELNGIEDPDVIAAGQVLKLP